MGHYIRVVVLKRLSKIHIMNNFIIINTGIEHFTLIFINWNPHIHLTL